MREKDNIPLAYRMRPRSLEEFVGQNHIVGKDKLLYRLIKADKLSSAIFYGPPGTGKTTLAEIIAKETNQPFYRLNAVSAGVKEIREIGEEARCSVFFPKRSCILFLDEIHRLNKAQQDALLPYVEDGTIVLIGATTENPYFTVNSALLSRSTVFRFYPLEKEEIKCLIGRTLQDTERGLGSYKANLSLEGMEYLAEASRGDVRVALNALELAVLTTERNEETGFIDISLSVIEECVQQKAVRYDRDGDNHYDVISAFIKSMRGTDPDATLHYLARMLAAGEDPNFIARRIVIAAAEDVGLANPLTLQTAVAAANAVQMIGMPEAQIILSEAALMVACSPKSNAGYLGIKKAMEEINSREIGEVPLHLRDAHYYGSRNLGHGKGYHYPHDYPDHYVKQQYLPDILKGTIYYRPTSNGYEKKISEMLTRLREE